MVKLQCVDTDVYPHYKFIFEGVKTVPFSEILDNPDFFISVLGMIISHEEQEIFSLDAPASPEEGSYNDYVGILCDTSNAHVVLSALLQQLTAIKSRQKSFSFLIFNNGKLVMGVK